jgi:hypothetical protein
LHKPKGRSAAPVRPKHLFQLALPKPRHGRKGKVWFGFNAAALIGWSAMLAHVPVATGRRKLRIFLLFPMKQRALPMPRPFLDGLLLALIKSELILGGGPEHVLLGQVELIHSDKPEPLLVLGFDDLPPLRPAPADVQTPEEKKP